MWSYKLWTSSALAGAVVGVRASIELAGGRLAGHHHMERGVSLQPTLQGPLSGGVGTVQECVGLGFQHNHRVVCLGGLPVLCQQRQGLELGICQD